MLSQHLWLAHFFCFLLNVSGQNQGGERRGVVQVCTVGHVRDGGWIPPNNQTVAWTRHLHFSSLTCQPERKRKLHFKCQGWDQWGVTSSIFSSGYISSSSRSATACNRPRQQICVDVRNSVFEFSISRSVHRDPVWTGFTGYFRLMCCKSIHLKTPG